MMHRWITMRRFNPEEIDEERRLSDEAEPPNEEALQRATVPIDEERQEA